MEKDKEGIEISMWVEWSKRAQNQKWKIVVPKCTDRPTTNT